ncbi:hypothetical protein ORV05_13190 [Amycolatopsis cynarae]|uniref:Leucine rich repeat variant n=1 Tax=Amycolatopsis cynarae TaxID=2995223 RepID=A0ABY7B9S1_9PSEU|nr:hypothetical protein [Amycolatopsis sp. HUAS 11-8]WAL68684.1 hypothetical protein ORV05_13190 [Amycolatopsis sp. HUAS 11-8]
MNHVLYGIAANPALPSELVDRLIEIADEEMAIALADRVDLSVTQAVALAARRPATVARLVVAGLLTTDVVDPAKQPRAALALLAKGAGNPAWARELATDAVVEHRLTLAGCPGLAADVVDVLAADPDPRVVAELALWTTSAVIAARLAEHPHAEVRSAAALNEATPPAVLAALLTGEGLLAATRCLVCDREEIPFVHDPHCPRTDCTLRPGAACHGSHESTVTEMHHRALRNPASPAAAVIAFADHPSMLLRQQLAARLDLPPAIHRRLAEDPIPGVRSELAENPAIDDTLIRVLAHDQGHDVQRRLAHNPNVPLDVLNDLARTTKIGPTLLPRIAAASPVEVQELAASPNPVIRMLLAQRRDLPAKVRETLAADPDAKVAKSIAPHPGLHEAHLRTMIERHGVKVLAAVAMNPDASPALLHDLVRHEPAARKAFRAIARHPNATASALLACLSDKRARPHAAGHPALPPLVITQLLNDDDWQTVEAAAANAFLPLAAIKPLIPGSVP